jgi:hypothetical protein
LDLAAAVLLIRVKFRRSPLATLTAEIASMRMSIAVLALLGGCSPFCPLTPQADPERRAVTANDSAPLPLAVPVKDLMEGAVAFSGHVIDQVKGSGAPLTKSDWGAARVASSDLAAAATLLTIPNDNALDALRRRDPEWRSLAKALQEAAMSVGTASRTRDMDRLAAAVSDMHAACRACHAKYGVHGE